MASLAASHGRTWPTFGTSVRAADLAAQRAAGERPAGADPNGCSSATNGARVATRRVVADSWPLLVAVPALGTR